MNNIQRTEAEERGWCLVLYDEILKEEQEYRNRYSSVKYPANGIYISEIYKSFPKLICNEIVAIQPPLQSNGLVFYLKQHKVRPTL